MIKQWLNYFLNFVVLSLIQVLVLNHLNLGGFINPYLYILFLLILPVEIPGWLLLLLGFCTGLFMDAFLNTPGFHASASVFLCFMRPYFLRYIAPRDGYESGSLPIPSYFGFIWFLKYAVLGVLAHHIFYFFIEAFTMSQFFSTLLRIFLSSVFTLLFIMIAQLFGRSKVKQY
jgi:rod shape-determining protein MreD